MHYQVLEKRGNFAQAIKLWELVRQANPTDLEAQHKVKDLAASDTIARGGYEQTINEKRAAETREAEATREHAAAPTAETEVVSPPPMERSSIRITKP